MSKEWDAVEWCTQWSAKQGVVFPIEYENTFLALAAEAERRGMLKAAGIDVQPTLPLIRAAWTAYREGVADYKRAIERAAKGEG